MKKALVVFCGREFLSASENVSKRLLDKGRGLIVPRIVEQSKVEATITSCEYPMLVMVPLMFRLDKSLIRKAIPKLQLIHQWGVGTEGVDIEEATKHKILVANTPSNVLTAQATAEQAVRLLLDASRWTFGHPSPSSLSENWGGPRGNNLLSRRFAVVGSHGAVGSRICTILRNGFGVDVIGIGRKDARLSDTLRNLPPLDGIIIATPLNPTTRAMVNSDVFDSLKPGAIVVNVGRGALVDRDALVIALDSDPMLRFASDVWWSEPADFTHDPLLSHPRVILSPHIGGLTQEASVTNDERCAQGILDFVLEGKVPTYSLNSQAVTGKRDKSPANDHSKPSSRHHQQSLHSVAHPPTLTRPPESQTQRVLEELRMILPHDRITTNVTELLRRGTDESLHDPVAPDICVMPATTEQVSKILKICSKYVYPVVPFGRGTSLEGGVSALAGGLSVDLSLMNRILCVNEKDFDCLVESGVSRLQLNQELRSSGLFFPVDPGADATLGGMASTRASGTTAVRYGTMRDRVMGLTVVLPNGDVVKTGSRALKSSAGYDLTGLFVGSEGTMGVVTEVRLKLAPIPESFCSAVARFKDIASAVNSVIELKQMGVPLARAEFLDQTTMRAVRMQGLSAAHEDDLDLPSVFLEFHGSESSVKEQSGFAKSMAENLVSYHESTKEEERNRLWKARHNAYYSVMKLRPVGTKGWPTDVCVPVSRLAECITDTSKDVEEEGLIAPIFGHVGDGNFHCILLHNPALDGEAGLVKLQRFNERLVTRALKMEGTCTGEHGIGYGKKNWLKVEHGPLAVKLMEEVKRAVDPQGIMNPGKLF